MHSGSLQLFLSVNFFLIFHTIMLLHLSCCSYILYRWQGINLMIFLLFMFFQDLNFVLPWSIIAVSKFLLVILEISPSFLQDITIALPLDAVNLVCSDIDIDIYWVTKLYLWHTVYSSSMLHMAYSFNYLASLCFWVLAISIIFLIVLICCVLCNFCHYSVPVLQLPIVLLSWHLTKCELNWSCSVGSQNSSGLTYQILFICCSVRNFLTIWYVLSMSAFCVRLYRAVWKLSRFDVLCKLFGIILVEYSTNGTICTVFSCHIHISSSFISYHYYFGLWSIQFLFTELRHFSSTNYCVLFIAWQVKCFGCPPPTHPPTHDT